MNNFNIYFNGGNEIRFFLDVNNKAWAEFVVTVSHLKGNLYVATVTEFSGVPKVATEFLDITENEHALPNKKFIFNELTILVTPQSIEVSVLN